LQAPRRCERRASTFATCGESGHQWTLAYLTRISRDRYPRAQGVSKRKASGHRARLPRGPRSLCVGVRDTCGAKRRSNPGDPRAGARKTAPFDSFASTRAQRTQESREAFRSDPCSRMTRASSVERLAAVSVDLDEIPCYAAIHGVDLADESA